MPIHRQFTASCDSCEVPFTQNGFGYFQVTNGVAEYCDDLRKVMKESAWRVGNKIVCPLCQTAAAAHGISIKQLTTREK